MAEGPAEGEWEEDAGMGAAAAERRREMEREKAKAEEAGAQPAQQKVACVCRIELFPSHRTVYDVKQYVEGSIC